MLKVRITVTFGGERRAVTGRGHEGNFRVVIMF